MSSKTQRLLNLVFVLVNTKQPVSRAEIFQRVREYGESTALDTKVRMFERDKAELRASYGDIIATRKVSSDSDEDGYLIDRDAFTLPPLDLSARERAILSLAGTVWGNAQLAGPGHEAGFLLGRGLASDDTGALAGRSGLVGVLYEAIVLRRVVTFTYDSKRRNEVSVRRVEPWRVFCTGGAWYLVGHDLTATADDGSPGARRIFRLSRVLTDIEMTSDAATRDVPTELDVRALVDGWLALPSTTKTAVLHVRHGTCGHLRLLADDIQERDSMDTLTITYEVEDRLARAIAAVCDRVVVDSPRELRAAVDDIVTRAVAHE